MRGAGRRGQTAVEYLMIAGIMTAIIIMLSGIVVPTMRWVTRTATNHILVYLSSPVPQDHGPQPCPEFAEPEEGVDCIK
jgi:Flp pilus assembly pilin Flp